MTIKRTENFTSNIRQETVPDLDDSQYQSLLEDASVEVSEQAGQYLVTNGYAVEE